MESSSNPSKLSLSTSFLLPSSVPIRAPVTVDDENDTDLESNDNKLDSPSTTVSVIGSELESSEDDPDEEFRSFACGESVSVRPFAQLSWDSDDYDCRFDHSDLESFGGVVEFSPSVSIVRKISVAPRVKMFGVEGEEGIEGMSVVGSENGFRSDEDEEEENGGSFSDLDSAGVEETAKRSLKVEIEEHEVVVIENCRYGPSEGEEEVEGNEELKELLVEKSLNVDSGAGVLWVGEECSPVSEEVVVTEKNSKLDIGFEQVNARNESTSIEISDEPKSVVSNAITIEFNLYEFSCPTEEAKECVNSCQRNVSALIEAAESMVDFEASQRESSVSNEDNRADCHDGSELSKEISMVKFEDDSREFDGLDEEEKKIKLLRVKFLRLVHRLRNSFRDPEVTRVQNNSVVSNHFGPIESSMKMALDLKSENETSFDFSLNIMVIGKSGVGKSATINLIFGDNNKAVTNAFEPATTSLKEIVGTVNGVKVTILDTPGLNVSVSEQRSNRKLLSMIHKRMKKFPPDIVLYVDRSDTETSDSDFPIMKSITDSLGWSIWENAIIVLTHSSSVGNDIVAARKSHVILDFIGKSLGEVKSRGMNLRCRISLVENNPTVCEDSNGRSELLLSCYSMKVLSLANSAPKPKGCRVSEAMLEFFARPSHLERDLSLGDESEHKIQLDSSIDVSEFTNNVLPCLPRIETELRNFEINETSLSQNQSPLALFRSGCGKSILAFLQARFEVRRVAKIAAQVRVGDRETARIQVAATGSGLLTVVMAGVIQMVVISGLMSKWK